MHITAGHLLGGRIRYAQPRDGYRTGIEPVLLAASIPARPGQRVLEAGTGAGAGLLCLAARVPHVSATGIELDPAMADLARQNAAENRLDHLDIITADIAAIAAGPFDHAFANPPWHDPRATPSPLPRRRLAKQEEKPAELERWIAAMAAMLADGGSLTLILPATLLERACHALRTVGALTLQPFAPKCGRPPKLLVIQTRKRIDQPDRALPPLTLHQPGGAFTPAIESVLRQAAALPMAA